MRKADLAPLDKALTTVATRMTEDLQENAREKGWPEPIVKSMRVVNREFVLVVDRQDAQSMEPVYDLEFGSAKQPPNPAIHTTLYTHQAQAKIRKETQVSLAFLIPAINRLFA